MTSHAVRERQHRAPLSAFRLMLVTFATGFARPNADAGVRSLFWRDRDRDTRDASTHPLCVAYSGAAVLSFWRRAATPTSGAG
jgi:hypothetical protein